MSVGFSGRKPISMFCGNFNNNFSMSVKCLWESIYEKETFALSVGSYGSLNNSFSMSVGFCGSLIIVFQCLWDVCGTKKKHLQSLSGSVVILKTVFQCLYDVSIY